MRKGRFQGVNETQRGGVIQIERSRVQTQVRFSVKVISQNIQLFLLCRFQFGYRVCLSVSALLGKIQHKRPEKCETLAFFGFDVKDGMISTCKHTVV